MPASGLYFLSYEYVKDYTGKNFGTEGSTGLIGTICAGGAAGLGYWAVGMPGKFYFFEVFLGIFGIFERKTDNLEKKTGILGEKTNILRKKQKF